MTWNSTMGLISSIALFLPILSILALRLGTYKTFPYLLVYYTTVLVYNLFTVGYIKVDDQIVQYWGLANNLLDLPLLITFMHYFSTSAAFTRRLKQLTYTFIAFEIIVVFVAGFTVNAITIILGPALLIEIALFAMFFIRQTKIAISHKKAMGKALISAALLFAYGCYGIIYLMYYIFKTPYIQDTFLIFFLVTTFSSLLVSTGIVIEQKRIRKLSELKITRRELSDIYANEQKVIRPAKKVMLDFDREQWN